MFDKLFFTKNGQISESLALGIFLTLAGGSGPDRRLSGCVYLPYPGWSVRQRPDRKYRAARTESRFWKPDACPALSSAARRLLSWCIPYRMDQAFL